MTTAGLLRQHCLESCVWFHPATGEHRDVRTVAKLKAMGVRRGIPEFCLIGPGGQVHFMELKRIGGQLTPEQEDLRLWSVRSAVPYVVARTIDDVLTAFDEWQCLRVKIGGSP
jgi:hypothetical protein